MHEKKIEGLLLQAIPYLGKQKILKVLTPSDGLLTILSKKQTLESLTEPFLIAEWVIRSGKGEMYTLKDATLIKDLSDLRTDYRLITIAGQIARDLLKTQWPEKPGSGPYSLAVAFLQKIATSVSPETLHASFRLKLLYHDGHLNEEALPFPIQDQQIVHQLTFARQFHILQNLKIEKTLQDKIESIFVNLNS
jgi:DNA repair protein RecO